MNLWHLLIIFFMFCFIYKNESSKIRPNFDEIFGEEWDKKECEENGEENDNESIGQMHNDQNIIKIDENAKENPNDQQKREIIQKFEAIKEKLKEKGKLQRKDQNKIERKIAKNLSASREKIYKWKKELNLNKRKRMQNSFYEQKKKEFIKRFDEFKSLYGQGKQKEFVKELGISYDTFWKWKKELVPKYHKSHMVNKYSNEDKSKKMKQYFEMKERNPKMSDQIIAKKLSISYETLKLWKKKFFSLNDF